MQKSSPTLPVDPTLTPQNAKARGYRWTDDIAYDPATPFSPSLFKDVQSLLNDGYKLGRAQQPISSVDIGLYEPVKP